MLEFEYKLVCVRSINAVLAPTNTKMVTTKLSSVGLAILLSVQAAMFIDYIQI